MVVIDYREIGIMRVHHITDKGRRPKIGDLIVDAGGNVGQYGGFPFNMHVDPALAEEARKAVRWSRGGVAPLKGFNQADMMDDIAKEDRFLQQMEELALEWQEKNL